MRIDVIKFVVFNLLVIIAAPVRAQDVLLSGIEKSLSEGNCQIAEKLYEDYKNAYNLADSNIEKSIYKCRKNRVGTEKITIRVNNVSFDMVKVKAGSFMMGCTDEQGYWCDDNEKPSHNVTLTKDYYIGVYEVTQELYEAVMGVNPSSRKARFSDRPVGNVCWDDAQKFCAELSRLTGRDFSLPTEAEWEYAARGGQNAEGTLYSGSSMAEEVAWYKKNSGKQTNPVGRLLPNELGIYDMSGNVWEWCEDAYGEYINRVEVDPDISFYDKNRVLRGGYFGCEEGGCRVSRRIVAPTWLSSDAYGFRVVLHLMRNKCYEKYS